MNQEQIDELAARRAARPDLDWDAIEAWIGRSLSLLKPGGVLSLALPDGKAFVARKVADHG
jgi:hypothetical protein